MRLKCILRTFVRVVIGLLFIFSGYVKAVDPVGSAIKFGEYFEAFGMHALMPGALVFGILLAVAELMIGLCFLFGLHMKLASLGAVIFMIFFTILTFILAVTNAVKDCGCFGDAIKLDNWQTFYKNLIILPFVIYAFVERRNYRKILCLPAEWLVVGLLLLATTGISVYSYRHLPLIDFLPYRVGVNIPEAMIVPDGAPEDVYETTFIYKKDGVEKEFTIDNFPEDDSWTFVDQKTKLLSRGYTPPAKDFSISSPQGHVHDEIFAQGGYLLFAVSTDIEKLPSQKAQLVNDLYSYSSQNGINFILLANSSEESNIRYIEKTNAQYPIYFTDETVLKSMVRSNPGMMLLKDNTVLKKWNYNDFPSVEELKQLISAPPQTVIDNHKRCGQLTNLLLACAVLILLVVFSVKSLCNNKSCAK